MADPWNNLTPTVGNVVRDVVPPEFIALKQVNLDRYRFLAANNTAEVNIINAVAGVLSPAVAIRWIQLALNRGTYNNATGEYVCDQTGWYRIEAFLNDFICTKTNLDILSLELQKYTGGAWSEIRRVQPNAAAIPGLGNYFTIAGYVQLTSGDKIRTAIRCNYSTTALRSVSGMGALESSLVIEFVRT